MKICPNCQTQNEDDARYCSWCNFALGPGAPPPAQPPDAGTVVIPPSVDPPTISVRLEPKVARVSAGTTAQVRVRLANHGGEEVQVALRVLGDVTGQATLDPVRLWLSPDEEALTLLELGAPRPPTMRVEYEVAAVPLRAGVETACTQGIVETAERDGPRSRLLPALGVALLALAAIVLTLVLLLQHGGVDGRVNNFRGANVREREDINSRRIAHLPFGTPVEVACVAPGPGSGRGWARLSRPDAISGRFVARGLLTLEKEPGAC